jgi:hypothetical protein
MQDALLALGLSVERIVIAVLLGLIYLAIVWTQIGPREGGSETLLRIALSIAPILTLPIIYVWKFVVAPAKLYAEAENKIQQLEASLIARPNEKLEALNEVFNRTRQISDDRPMTPEAYETWKRRINEHLKWIQEVLRGKLSETEINILLNGPSGPRLSFGGSFGLEENNLNNYLRYLEQRIGQLVERYASV